MEILSLLTVQVPLFFNPPELSLNGRYQMFCFSTLNLPMSSLSLPSTSLNLSRFPLKFEQKESFYTVKCNKKSLAETTHVSGSRYSDHDHAFIKTGFLPSQSRVSVVARNAKGSGSEDDGRALETVLKLYTAIKDRDLDALSDVIGEECRCVCNFVSAFQPWEGKTVCPVLFIYIFSRNLI